MEAFFYLNELVGRWNHLWSVHKIVWNDFELRAKREGPKGEGMDSPSKSLCPDQVSSNGYKKVTGVSRNLLLESNRRVATQNNQKRPFTICVWSLFFMDDWERDSPSKCLCCDQIMCNLWSLKVCFRPHLPVGITGYWLWRSHSMDISCISAFDP